MRKQFKVKARSCALCKPHKRGLSHRWKPRERQALRDAELVMRGQGIGDEDQGIGMRGQEECGCPLLPNP